MEEQINVMGQMLAEEEKERIEIIQTNLKNGTLSHGCYHSGLSRLPIRIATVAGASLTLPVPGVALSAARSVLALSHRCRLGHPRAWRRRRVREGAAKSAHPGGAPERHGCATAGQCVP